LVTQKRGLFPENFTKKIWVNKSSDTDTCKSILIWKEQMGQGDILNY
jgi:hypothetical protein